jgi:hypothetical protein
MLVTRSRTANPPGPGWGSFKINCPKCHLLMFLMRPIYTRGFHCPYCRHDDPDLVWSLNGVEPHDGAYLNPIGWKYATTNNN